MKVNNIFESIQGEGRYAGEPVIFVRLAGCNLDCDWCDTDFSNEIEMSSEELAEEIQSHDIDTVVWTGGEPMLQFEEIKKTINLTQNKHHLETNGTKELLEAGRHLDYIAISPKDKEDIERLNLDILHCEYDVKVVTDGEMNKDMFEDATMLMPLTTFNKDEDKVIKQKVWKICQEKNLKYSPRLQIDLFGEERGV